MLTTRRLLVLVFAFAFTTVSGMAADTGIRPDIPRAYPYLETMFADLEPCCGDYDVAAKGKMLATYWYDFQGEREGTFTINTKVLVPNPVEGFWTPEDAMHADVRVTFARLPEGQFAECYLAFQDLEFVPGIGEPAVAHYELELMVQGDFVKPLKGVCDVGMYQPGIQVGAPELQLDDTLETMTVIEGKRTSYLKGFCE